LPVVSSCSYRHDEFMSDAEKRAKMTNPTAGSTRVELRLATADDADAVRRLAALDEQRELAGPVLIAVVDGTAVAALSVQDGRSVADPFVLTRELVALLRLRAEHLTGPSAKRGRGWLRLRLRTAPA
jgi:hypothetical protein